MAVIILSVHVVSKMGTIDAVLLTRSVGWLHVTQAIYTIRPTTIPGYILHDGWPRMQLYKRLLEIKYKQNNSFNLLVEAKQIIIRIQKKPI